MPWLSLLLLLLLSLWLLPLLHRLKSRGTKPSSAAES